MSLFSHWVQFALGATFIVAIAVASVWPVGVTPSPLTTTPPAIPAFVLDDSRGDGLLRGASVGASPNRSIPRPASFLADRGIPYEFYPVQNWSGRGINEIEAIVVHVTGPGTCPGMRSWFNNPAAFASSHFGVCKDGSVEQYVEVGDAAWHAGRLNRPNTNNPLIKNWLDNGINPNLRTVGVEMLLAPGERIGDYPLLVKAFDDLLLWLVAATGVAPDRVHIIGHNEIDSVNRAIDPICCWDINRGVKYVASRVATTPEEVTLESLAEQLDRVIERLNKAGIP